MNSAAQQANLEGVSLRCEVWIRFARGGLPAEYHNMWTHTVSQYGAVGGHAGEWPDAVIETDRGVLAMTRYHGHDGRGRELFNALWYEYTASDGDSDKAKAASMGVGRTRFIDLRHLALSWLDHYFQGPHVQLASGRKVG